MNNKIYINDNDIDIDILIENKWNDDFFLLMNELKNIGKQIITIRNKVDELKKDRLFIKKLDCRVLR